MGRPLAATLFMFINDWAVELQERVPGVQLLNGQLLGPSSLLYADDLALVANRRQICRRLWTSFLPWPLGGERSLDEVRLGQQPVFP